MLLKKIKLKNFRNYEDSAASLSPGINIIIGDNGAGKSNILEAAQFCCCGCSFRTSREAEMIGKGQRFFRLEAEIEDRGQSLTRHISYEAETGVRVNAGGGPEWLRTGSILSFSPDDLQLVKGPPATRRRFLDDAVSRRRPAHHRRLLDYQKVLSQRNSFLQRARAGLTRLADIRPWDRQLAALAILISRARREMCRDIQPHFIDAYNGVTGDRISLRIGLVSQVGEPAGEKEPEAALVERLEKEWSKDMEGARTGTGSHRDDMELTLDGRSLRRYGSQGEQRTAVLALLLAGRGLAIASGERPPVLLLDDVMSELDRGRRHRLMAMLRHPEGQTLITAADRGLFLDGELEGAAIMEVCRGAVLESWAESSV